MPNEISHDHVAIRAVDYAGTIAWYRDKLDFTVDQEWPFGDMQLAYLSNGTAKIEILGGSAAEPHARIFGLSLAVVSAACLVLNAASPSTRVCQRYRGDAVRGSLPCTVALWTRHVAPITW